MLQHVDDASWLITIDLAFQFTSFQKCFGGEIGNKQV